MMRLCVLEICPGVVCELYFEGIIDGGTLFDEAQRWWGFGVGCAVF
jgi:hypothetical protein